MAVSSPTAIASTHDPVRLSGVDYLGDLPTLVAVEEGIFQRHGLAIEVDRRASGRQNIQALRTQETDIALMAPAPLVLELLASPNTGADNDLLILASLVYSSRLNHVVTPRNSGILVPEDLAGRRIGLMAGTNAEFLWWLFTALHGIDPDEVRVIDLPVSTLPGALVEGDIDAAILWEPWTSRLESRLSHDDLTFLPGSDIYTENWILVTTRGVLQQRPDTAHRLLSAYQEAIRIIDTDPKGALTMYTEAVGLDTLHALHDPYLPLFGLSLDWTLLASLQQLVQWARDTDKPIADPGPSILSWIDAGPLQQLLPGAASIPIRDTPPEAPSP
ncbi:ABC transporter substrate-binding protein [Halomonas sp. BC04]|uniref:ABC transporter substrate-binding protein n=1 Tax=Halomonas sp. BC04 TaxID=1403540 RepID=UPI0005B9F2F3|nr:NrtA/SsuA/CpmA family ABC transporter substrate-binding protein [Halomonas sp. BC04]